MTTALNTAYYIVYNMHENACCVANDELYHLW